MNLRYYKSRYYQEKALRKQLQKEVAELKAKGKRGKKQRYFTTSGGLSLAVHSNLTTTPARTLGLALHVDVHRTTVTNWELFLDSCMRCSNYAFYEDGNAALYGDGPNDHGDGGFAIDAAIRAFGLYHDPRQAINETDHVRNAFTCPTSILDFHFFGEMELVVFRCVPIDDLNGRVGFFTLDKLSHANAIG